METLFGHLATRFAPSSENIAIEALGFILSRSPAARRALTSIASACGVTLPLDLVFATQAAAEDAARPDIEGYGSDLRRHLVCECKFWAGLTINQPLTYAARLPSDAAGTLLFIVPSARLNSLWPELTKRLIIGGHVLGRQHTIQQEVWAASLGSGHAFVLASWRAVIAAIQSEMEGSGETERLADLRQLSGLCEHMDREAFLPFRSEELTAADTPQRYVQLSQLAYDLGETLVGTGVCDAKRLTAAGGMGYYGRYLRAGGIVFFVAFDSVAWHAHRLSPLWLRLDQYAPPLALDALRRGNVCLGDTPIVVDKDGRVLLPLMIEVGQERPQIVQSLAEQTTRVLAAINGFIAANTIAAEQSI